METLYSRGLNFINPFLSLAVNFDNQTLICVDTKFLRIKFSIQNYYDKSVFTIYNKACERNHKITVYKTTRNLHWNSRRMFQFTVINKKFCRLKIADVKQTIENFLLALRLETHNHVLQAPDWPVFARDRAHWPTRRIFSLCVCVDNLIVSPVFNASWKLIPVLQIFLLTFIVA